MKVKIEELKKGDVLPGGAVVSYVAGIGMTAKISDGTIYRTAPLAEIIGPEVEVERKSPELKPFTGTQVAFSKDWKHPGTVEIALEDTDCDWPCESLPFKLAVVPLPLPEEVQEAASWFAVRDSEGIKYANVLVNFVKSLEGK